MTTATQAKRGKKAAAPASAEFGSDHIPTNISSEDANDSSGFATNGYFERMQRPQKKSPTALIAGGVTVVAALALLAGVTMMGKTATNKDTETGLTPAQVAQVNQALKVQAVVVAVLVKQAVLVLLKVTAVMVVMAQLTILLLVAVDLLVRLHLLMLWVRLLEQVN